MRVLINALSARHGGGRTYMINLLEHIDLADFAEVIILAPTGLVLPQRPKLRRLPPPILSENPFARAAWEFARLPALIRRLRVDVLFAPGGLLPARPVPDCRLVTMFRNTLPFEPAVRGRIPLGSERLRNWILRRAIPRSMQQADLVIFVSDHARRLAEDSMGRPLKQAVTIPHGLGDAFRAAASPPKPRLPWTPRGQYLLYVSPLHAYKSQLEVVRAFHLLNQERAGGETLILAGSNHTPYGRRVRAEVDRLGLAAKVLMPGEIPYRDLPALYAHAKINLFASECESISHILLEALGSARPLLASDRPVVREIAGEAARYFEPREPHALADALRSVLDDDLLLARMAQAAAAQAARHSWESTADATWRAIWRLHTQTNPEMRREQPRTTARSPHGA